MTITIGLDFDGTLVEHLYPKIGPAVPGAIEWLQKISPHATYLLNTMRDQDELTAAVKWCQENGIKIHAANRNPGQLAWTSSPKVYANVYVDDSSIGIPLVPGIKGPRRMVDWSKVGPDLFAKAVAHQNIASDVQSLHVVFKTHPTILPSHPSRGDSFGSWVFSDRSAGLVDEPFVSGADTLIEAIAKQGGFLAQAKKTGVVAAFSANEFAGALVCLVRDQREDPSGNWYTESTTGHRAWLCPALYHYFSEAPKKLWINIWPV